MKIVRSHEKIDDKRLESLLELQPELEQLVKLNSKKHRRIRLITGVIVNGLAFAAIMVALHYYNMVEVVI